ncbi:hypothetical protein KDW_45450 [Dictyobacter vulcani]|uniref:Uncharacterized protein n=1 Tax=Dictyobacter vulcani TaxID=2607529 RepID=A0A5J4KRU6_9CHLR|nr:hypothetical protein [Dictyobacter vulcani]GER90383.1 hypothetical protein KDW_45450 [Dictyobacter vulcani]
MADQEDEQTRAAQPKKHIQGQQETYGSHNYVQDTDADERETFRADVKDTSRQEPFGLDKDDEYGPQHQFGDLDGQDPFSNLDD